MSKKDAKSAVPVADRIVGGKSIAQWDTEWVFVDGGFKKLHSDLTKVVGLYRADLDGSTMAVGQGIEYRNGGLRKRLADFRRESWSGRNHSMGRRIWENKDSLDLYVLRTGSDKMASDTAKLLKNPMIELQKPPWNAKQSEIDLAIEQQADKG